MAAITVVQLVNDAIAPREGVSGNIHARAQGAFVVWSCNVSAGGIKVWADGRVQVPGKGLLESAAKHEQRLREVAEAQLAEAVELCTRRVEAALAVV